jgi:hypothetical protein
MSVGAIGVSSNAPSFSRWAQSALAQNAAGMTDATNSSGPGDLMSYVMSILRKAGLDGSNGSVGMMSFDDIQRLMQALHKMGPAAIKQVLKANPGFTNMLNQALPG